MTDITLPKNLNSISEGLFKYCEKLERIQIPESVTSIGQQAFQECKALASITMPERITSIGQQAFQECKALTNITIPASVTSIGSYAFLNCNSVTDVYCYLDAESASAIVELPSKIPSGNNITWHVKADQLEAYQQKYSSVNIKGDLYTVTFNSNGGTEVAAQIVAGGNKATKPAAPTKEGYTFTDWYNGDAKFDFNTAVTTNITLTAKWTISPATISTQPADVTMTYGDANKSVSVTAANLAGQLSYQWYCSNTAGFTPDDSNKIKGATGQSYAIPSNTPAGTFYGKCVATNTDGSSTATVTSNEATVTINKATVTEPVINSKTYTGDKQTAYVAASTLYTVTTNNGGTAVGNYDVVLTLTDAGNYKWTDSEVAAKTLKFNITKATAPTVNVPPPEAVTYDPARTLADVALADGWAWTDSNTVPTVSNSGYQAALTVDGDNYDYSSVDGYSAETKKVTRTVALTVNKAAATAATVTANNRTYDGTEKPLVTVTGETIGGEMKYAVTTVNQEPGVEAYTFNNTSIPTATDAGTYYVWYKVVGDENHNDTEAVCVNVEIKKAVITVTADAKNITYGYEDVPLTYKVSGLAEGDTADKVLTGTLTREAGTDAGTYKITQGSLTSADYGITFVGADYVIAKAAQAAPVESFTTSKATGSDTSDGKLSGFADAKAYQISSDNGATWIDVEASSTSLDVKAGDYRIRYAGDKNHEAGASVSVTVGKKADQSKPEGLETENVSAENATDGVVTGVTDAMEYSTDDGKTWTAVPANADKIDGLAAGEVLVRYAETDDKNASPAATVVVGVASRTEGEVKFKPDADGTNIEDKAITGVDDSPNESLDEFAKTQKEVGKDVKVEVEITPVKKDKVTAESVTQTKKVVDDVFKGIEKEKVVTEYLEIDVAKYVNNERENDTISDTNKPIEIPLKYNTTKGNPVVIRTHEGVAKAFGKLKSRPAKKDYKDAMFYIDPENAILYIYSQYFSDFAIVYATETTYNVVFVSGTGVNLSPLVVAEGGKVTLPTGLKNDGYAFDGWYQDEAYKTAWKDSDTVSSDITLYAKWNKSVSGVSVSPSDVKLTKAGETSQIKITVTPSDAANTKVTYKSSDTKVATVDANGKITAVANGTATITVTTEDGAKTATVKVTVSIPEVKPQGTEEPVQQPTKEEKAVISMNAGLKISQTGSKINIKWGKVGEADGYDVYVAYCGKKFGKAVKTINKNSTTSITVKKINGKKIINLKKNFKVYVAAYKLTDGKKEVLAKSIMGHVVGRLNTRYSNAKKITLSKSKYSVKVGKTVKVKAKTVLVDKSKKQLSDGHAKEFRYATSNKNIATVDKNGKVKGVAKGICTIYVYARNGYAKTVKVTVK